MCLNHLPNPGCLVSRVCHETTILGVPYVSSGKLISGCDFPGGCQPPRISEGMVSSWEPAHGLVEDAVSGTEIATTPWLLLPAVTSLPLCLQVGKGQYSASSPLVFTQSFVL